MFKLTSTLQLLSEAKLFLHFLIYEGNLDIVQWELLLNCASCQSFKFFKNFLYFLNFPFIPQLFLFSFFFILNVIFLQLRKAANKDEGASCVGKELLLAGLRVLVATSRIQRKVYARGPTLCINNYNIGLNSDLLEIIYNLQHLTFQVGNVLLKFIKH